MTTGMNLWDANVWSFVITMTLLFVAMIIANILKSIDATTKRFVAISSKRPSAVFVPRQGTQLILTVN